MTEETYQRNTREQYEALGRFVEAFEMMVEEVRGICISLISPGSSSPFSKNLSKIAFHHRAMTAQPLFEIMRAMVAEIAHDTEISDADERKTYLGVMAQIATEYADLCSTRNNLLHGTWFVGYTSQEDANSSRFYIRKHTTTADGLKSLDLPKTVRELHVLVDRCEMLRNWIAMLGLTLPFVGDFQITRRFRLNGKKWELKLFSEVPYEESKRHLRANTERQ